MWKEIYNGEVLKNACGQQVYGALILLFNLDPDFIEFWFLSNVPSEMKEIF